jgi:hypothetical protein
MQRRAVLHRPYSGPLRPVSAALSHSGPEGTALWPSAAQPPPPLARTSALMGPTKGCGLILSRFHTRARYLAFSLQSALPSILHTAHCPLPSTRGERPGSFPLSVAFRWKLERATRRLPGTGPAPPPQTQSRSPAAACGTCNNPQPRQPQPQRPGHAPWPLTARPVGATRAPCRRHTRHPIEPPPGSCHLSESNPRPPHSLPTGVRPGVPAENPDEWGRMGLAWG